MCRHAHGNEQCQPFWVEPIPRIWHMFSFQVVLCRSAFCDEQYPVNCVVPVCHLCLCMLLQSLRCVDVNLLAPGLHCAYCGRLVTAL